ncbi:hypothetical protein IDM40_12220 [Nocardiopsis sp. HNM0947]|uniref:Uncharacterized protein n=1 Tax=Nocardiopsis coralli TaxID=2772213 RepID=A0ABR9P6Y9_9ACTN|nr:hypothetical protein [Nocardiopsis coralli]MBE2999465.1 hypothetical protein [Nocardiopsis coralli]
MSPKKRKRNKPDPPAAQPETTDRADTATETAPADTTAKSPRPSREPVRVPDPPDRRITALWVGLALTWALGTPLALANLLFTFMDLQEAAMAAEQDPAAGELTTVPGDHLASLGTALIWVLILALAVPLIAAILAAFLRRKIAFIGFTVALAATALPLFLLMPPAELFEALRTHFTGP